MGAVARTSSMEWKRAKHALISVEKMVDLVGIEPTTSSMPWKRAPSCATGPQACSSILADWDEIVKPKALVRVQQIKGSIFPLNGTNRLILRLVYGEQVRLLAAL